MNAYVGRDDFVLDQPTTISRSGVGGGRSIRARVAGLFQWFAQVSHRRSVINELQALSDHELADIGLARGDLHRVFDPAFSNGR